MAQFLADDATQDLFKRFALMLNVFAQSSVDHCLVTAASCLFHLVSEPIQYLGIDPDCDPGLSSSRRNDWSSLCVSHVIFSLHFNRVLLLRSSFPSCCSAGRDQPNRDSASRCRPQSRLSPGSPCRSRCIDARLRSPVLSAQRCQVLKNPDRVRETDTVLLCIERRDLASSNSKSTATWYARLCISSSERPRLYLRQEVPLAQWNRNK